MTTAHTSAPSSPNDDAAFENIWPKDEVNRDKVSKPSLIAVREKNGRKIGY